MEMSEILDVKGRLSKVSPSFCLAKWLQVSLHLQSGQTHSCHHPNTHSISLEQISVDPSALHNTDLKKAARREMLEGKRPAECDYCWKVEDSRGAGISDRVIKSGEPWALPNFGQIAKSNWDENTIPSYLEISFSALCNLKCSYCGPHASSSWFHEIKSLGAYPTAKPLNTFEGLAHQGKLPLAVDEAMNPYILAFWKWWPEIYPKLKVLRITGGEPLLSDHLFQVMAKIAENPRSDFEFIVNTNLMAPKARIDNFFRHLEAVAAAKPSPAIGIYTSIDGWAERAEYMRHGLRHDYFWNNIYQGLDLLPQARFVIMCAFNALSVTGFRGLLEHLLVLKKNGARLALDVSFLRFPDHQSVKVLTPDFLPIVYDDILFMESHRKFFDDVEIEKLRRVYEWMLVPEDDRAESENRADFYRFFSEHDRRRGTSFENTFPELDGFWRLCEAHAAGL